MIDRLTSAGSSVRLNWGELESMVGELPASASKHRAWWSGDRSHVNAWQAAGFALTELQLGETVTFTRATGDKGLSANVDVVTGLDPSSTIEGRLKDTDGVDLVLVTCVKSKLEVPAPAKDLYISTLFTRQRAYAEVKGVPWFILSAEHGLVAPDEWLAPYERYLPDTPATYRDAWGRWVSERLELLAGSLQNQVIEIHAGSAYVDALSLHLVAKGAVLRNPLKGLSMGQRLGWYASRRADTEKGEGVRPH